MARASRKEIQMRLRLAEEAARILIDSGSRDFALAKRKAAEHLNAQDTRQMPSNQEIEQALAAYQRLFRSDQQPRHLRALRETACEAMRFFTEYQPRLVGPVLSGTADVNTPISLHVFSDTPEEVSLLLIARQIPFETMDKRLHIRDELYQNFPALSFFVQEYKVEVIIFPVSRRVPTPLSPVDGKPVKRATLEAVQALLTEETRPYSDIIGG